MPPKQSSAPGPTIASRVRRVSSRPRSRGLAAKNLSRTLEDAGTVFVPLVPWSAAGAYMTATLGVQTLDYLPWAILCYTGFIFAIIWGFTGFGIARLEDEK